MYKAPGTVISVYGTDRKSAINELMKQLRGIENLLQSFDNKFPHLKGNFLCGNEISLADATLFPTVVFCVFMLPQFFNIQTNEFIGPLLQKWFEFLSSEVSYTRIVRQEIEKELIVWRDNNGRFNPIMEEMKKYN